jgi:hypothetical protein
LNASGIGYWPSVFKLSAIRDRHLIESVSYRPDVSFMKLFSMKKDMNTYEDVSNTTVSDKLHSFSRLRQP